METYRGVVSSVIVGGKHGAYAKAYVEEIGTVTFSLSKPVWEEDDVPEEGFIVMLSDLRKKRAGWRAMRGRFVRPSDESTNEKPETRH